MAPAVADAAAASPPPPRPGPDLPRLDLAAVKALMFPCLAGLWVGGASAAAAAAAVTHAVQPSGECFQMIFPLIVASVGAIFFSMLLAMIVYVLLLCAALRGSDSVLQACGPSLRALLRDTAWLSFVAALTFDVLSVVGCFGALELSMGSRVGRIGARVIDVGAVISAAISCLDILPSTAIKVWRMKPGGSAADGCIV